MHLFYLPFDIYTKGSIAFGKTPTRAQRSDPSQGSRPSCIPTSSKVVRMQAVEQIDKHSIINYLWFSINYWKKQRIFVTIKNNKIKNILKEAGKLLENNENIPSEAIGREKENPEKVEPVEDTVLLSNQIPWNCKKIS